MRTFVTIAKRIKKLENFKLTLADRYTEISSKEFKCFP